MHGQPKSADQCRSLPNRILTSLDDPNARKYEPGVDLDHARALVQSLSLFCNFILVGIPNKHVFQITGKHEKSAVLARRFPHLREHRSPAMRCARCAGIPQRDKKAKLKDMMRDKIKFYLVLKKIIKYTDFRGPMRSLYRSGCSIWIFYSIYGV